MRERLVIAVVGIIVVPGLILWGLLSPGARQAAVASGPKVTQTPTPQASATAPTPSAKWRSIFDARFSGRLNRKVWGLCYPWGNPAPTIAPGCTNYGNHEEQWYLARQVHVANGMLDMVARSVPTVGVTKEGARTIYPCRSGMVTTFPSLRFEYGWVKITAKLPVGKGLWPALWMAAANEKWPPEMDLVEHWGTNDLTAVFFHPLRGHQLSQDLSGSYAGSWHTYSLNWTPRRLDFIVDGHVVLTTTQQIPHQKMYLILNLAYNGSGTPTCSGTFRIRRVQVWQRVS